MFENIIGQGEVVALLSEEIAEQRVPRSLLFHGPAYSGKMSTALELARMLSCSGDRGWGCPCASCRRHRDLSHPDLLMLGTRPFYVEIMASADALRRAPAAATRFLFARAVRKLLRRFDPVLWEGDSAARKYLPEAAEITAVLDDLGEGPEETVIEDICARSLKLTDAFQTGNIPIEHVRRASAWAHLVPHGRARVLILESAEGMLESSRNALLKLLEEPPSAVYVVLTTARRGAIMQTIQSRLRPYRFRDRSAEDQRQVLERIFRESSSEYATLRDYFLAWRDLNPHGLRTLAHRFLDLLADRDHSGADLATLLSEVFETGKASEAMSVFAEELLLDLQARLFDEELALPVLERWASLINQDILYATLYNPNPSMVLESLFHRMREAASGHLRFAGVAAGDRRGAGAGARWVAP